MRSQHIVCDLRCDLLSTFLFEVLDDITNLLRHRSAQMGVPRSIFLTSFTRVSSSILLCRSSNRPGATNVSVISQCLFKKIRRSLDQMKQCFRLPAPQSSGVSSHSHEVCKKSQASCCLYLTTTSHFQSTQSCRISTFFAYSLHHTIRQNGCRSCRHIPALLFALPSGVSIDNEQ
jgi:hypothetical protein